MTKSTTIRAPRTLGLDVGDQYTHLCFLSDGGDVVSRDRVRTTPGALRERLGDLDPARVALEVGRDSPWISRLARDLKHEVIVANARAVALIHQSDKKTDRSDAEKLARLARLDPALLHPIEHRSEELQCHLAVLRSRDQLVSTRTALINHVRGASKSLGVRLPSSSAEGFANKVGGMIPEGLQLALRPLVAQIASLTHAIRDYDRQIEWIAKERYPATELLRQVRGVGPVTALCYVLTLGDPKRFNRSRDVGSFLGLTPRKWESGDRNLQLRITKAGDPMLRRLLVGSAQYMLSRNGADCDLRRFGERICGKGGKSAKKRAAVAVARKLAVLLHRLWTTAEVYEPLRNAQATAV